MQNGSKILFSPLFLVLLTTMACSSSVTLDDANDDDAGNSDTGAVFSELLAADLTVSSPTNASAVSAALSDTASTGFAASEVTLSTSSTSDTVASLLSATNIADCAIDIEIPTQSSSPIPSCYGPTLDYENHPDIGDENSGELPSGDLGMWTETDDVTGLPCSAAELNYRLDLVEARIEMAQLSLASMVCVLNNSSTLSMPASGETVSMTSEFGDVLDSSSLSVTSANLTLDDSSGLKNYTYSLSLDVTDAATGGTQSLTINMTHEHLDASGETFNGLLTYQYNDTANGGNCVGDVTEAGSLKYNKDDTGNYRLRSDSAEFCMSDDAPFTDEGVLDPSYKYDGSTPGGWGNNYNIFIADYSPETLMGNYAYAWQAGHGDGFTRVFNVVLNQSAAAAAGDAYFGYGLDVADENFDGGIDGFICDWATGVSSHTLMDSVQHQSLLLQGDTYVTDESHILYAPTESCDYVAADDTDGYLFSYDLDGDGTISENETLTLSSDGITNELLDFSEMDFELPVAP